MVELSLNLNRNSPGVGMKGTQEEIAMKLQSMRNDESMQCSTVKKGRRTPSRDGLAGVSGLPSPNSLNRRTSDLKRIMIQESRVNTAESEKMEFVERV